MKIIRKKMGSIKIEHNRKLFWIILALILLLVAVIYFIVKNNEEINPEKNKCVPATCCHATECVLAESLLAPICKNAICSMICSGPLDCGAGHCEFINNKCRIVPDK
jgi:hypothetical protein